MLSFMYYSFLSDSITAVTIVFISISNIIISKGQQI